MKSIKNKALLISLLGILNASLPGCSNDVLYVDSEKNIESLSDDDIFNSEIETEETKTEEVVEKEVEEYIDKPTITSKKELIEENQDILSNIEFSQTVTADTDVNIRDNSVNGEVIGVLPTNSSLELLEVLDNGWYKVNYNGEVGYINENYAHESSTYEIESEVEKIGYTTKDTKITIPYQLSATKIATEKNVEAKEYLEVYDETEDRYLVKTNDYIGYIEKDSFNEFTDTYVVVDISDQELTLYKDDEIILTSPVVTGKPSSPTDEGLFEIYNITHNRYLVGPNYRSYVDIMMKYNGGEGLHDAEYHTHEDGFKHGWRSIDEFGGETYKTDGSHGCVNMPRDKVMEVSKHVSLGTKVLVKK